MSESEIKSLLQRLGESINEILSDSPEIHNRIQEIRNAGYEVFIAVETRIGFCSSKEKKPKDDDNIDDNIDEAEKPTELNLTEYDLNFLKSLNITTN